MNNKKSLAHQIRDSIKGLDYETIMIDIAPTQDRSGHDAYRALLDIEGLDLYFNRDLITIKFVVRPIDKPTLFQLFKQRVWCKHNFKKSNYLHYCYEATSRYKMTSASKYYREYKTVMKCKYCGHEEIGKYMGTSETGWSVHGPIDEWPEGFKETFNEVLQDLNIENFDNYGSWWSCEFPTIAAERFDRGGAKACRIYMENQLT